MDPASDAVDFAELILAVPDFPEPGIVFRDISPLLAAPGALVAAANAMANGAAGLDITHVVGIEARGFLFGPLIAAELGVGFVPMRKSGKLPRETHSVSYGLEYGADSLELHADALVAGDQVLVVDDVLATGGTAAAAFELVRTVGADPIGLAVLIELTSLAGRAAIGEGHVHSVVHYG